MNMRRVAAWLATGAMVTGSLAAVGVAPAAAVTYVEVDATNVSVRGDTCAKTEINAYGDWGGEAYGNSVSIDVYGPRGEWAGGDYVSDDQDGDVTRRVTLCGYYDRPGRYEVEVGVESWDEDGDTSVTGHTTFRFKVKKVVKKNAKIQTSKRKIRRGAYKWAVPGTLRRSGNRYKGARVWVQAKIEGYWWDIDSARTNQRGRFGWRYKPNPYRWRYVFKGDTKTKRAVSKPFSTKGSGRGAGLPAGRFPANAYDVYIERVDE